MYKCSQCDLAVVVYDDKGKVLPEPIKACKCKAAIVIDMSATVEGKGGIRV